MPKPYDRVKNADQRSDVFIHTPYWTPEIEAAFETWLAAEEPTPLHDVVDAYLATEISISFKAFEGSVCCTLSHQPSRDALMPHLITGWSDNCRDALAVAEYKLIVMLKGVWQSPPDPKPTRRR